MPIPIVESADILVVIGTSLNVYPAAGLVNYAKRETPIFVIDPERPSVFIRNVTYIQEKAGKGVEILKEKLKELVMKQFYLVVLLLTIVSLRGFSQRFEGGVLVGLNASQVDGDNYSGYHKPGIVLGGYVQTNLSRTVTPEWNSNSHKKVAGTSIHWLFKDRSNTSCD